MIIPNEALRDPCLSYRARGVLAEILSYPDDWIITADRTAARARRERGQRGEGRVTVRAAFAELKAAGYLESRVIHDSRGRFVTELHFYDRPAKTAASNTGKTPNRPGNQDVSAGRTDDRLTGRRLTGTPATGTPAASTPATGTPAASAPATGTPAGGTSSRRPATKNQHENSLSRVTKTIRAAVPDVTEREIGEIIRKFKSDPSITHYVAYLSSAVSNGDAAMLVADARNRLSQQQGNGRPAWCGICDEHTRMIGEDNPQRCPSCHPLRAGQERNAEDERDAAQTRG